MARLGSLVLKTAFKPNLFQILKGKVKRRKLVMLINFTFINLILSEKNQGVKFPEKWTLVK